MRSPGTPICGEREPVDRGIGLAQADHARLDEVVEQRAQPVAIARLAVVLPVVGERRRDQAVGAQPSERLGHRRPRLVLERDALEHGGGREQVAARRALGVEVGAELGRGELAALHPRPRSGRPGVADDAVEEPLGNPVLALVAGDGVKRRVDDDAADVEEYGLVVACGLADCS